MLGPSGCGKTTTLRMVSGFEEPNEGNIFIAGQDMKGKRPYERNVGLLFQDYALFPHMTVVQNVGYGLKNRGYEKSRIPARIEGDAGARQAHRIRGPASRAAQRRTAAARGAGPGPGGQPGGRAAGRAAVGPRRQAPTGIEGGAQGDSVGGRRHDDRRDPRPGGSNELGRQRHRHERGPDHATRPADRDLCRSEDPVRRRIHRPIQLVFKGSLGAGVAESVREFTTSEGHRLLVPGPSGPASDASAWEVCIPTGAHRHRVRAGAPRPAPADPPIG